MTAVDYVWKPATHKGDNDLTQQETRSKAFTNSSSETAMARGTSQLESHPDKNDEGQDSTKKGKHRAVVRASSYERQQRYREKQRHYGVCLETTVKRLRTDVDQLLAVRHKLREAQRAANGVPSRVYTISTRPTITRPFVNIMCQCMQSFQSGIRAQQARFLGSAMHADVQYGDLVGRKSILDQWTQFARSFDIAPIVQHCSFTVCFSEQASTLGLVRAMLALRLTVVSLDNIFPLANSSQHLRDKLLRSGVVEFPMTTLFEFDQEGKVRRYNPTIDFVRGLYAVLGDFRAVANALQATTVNASGQFCEEYATITRDRLIVSSCCTHDDLEPSSRCSTARVDKLSVAFILSSGEATDGDGQAAPCESLYM